MDIIIFVAVAIVFFTMAALNKQHRLVGLVAGIGLVMLALGVQTTGIQVQTGVNQTVYTALNSSQTIYLYSNMVDMGNLAMFQVALVIILGAAGLLILLNSVTTVKL
jgi:hypothetical protein